MNMMIFSATSNNKPCFTVFQFNIIENNFISNYELSLEYSPNNISPCLQLTYKADIQIAKQRIIIMRQNQT